MSLRRKLAKLGVLFRRRKPVDDLAEEIRTHLEMEERENRESGMPPEEAHYAALRRFGNVVLAQERSREMWGWNSVETLGQDVRFGFRQLRKSPGFTAVAVLTLALGIGADTAIFSVVDAVLLRPLPYAASDQLVQVKEHVVAEGHDLDWVSFPNFHDWEEQNTAFEGMAAYRYNMVTLTNAGDPEELLGAGVSASLFPLLGVRPIVGRMFLPAEDQPGHSHEVVLSYDLWSRRFGADWQVIGKTLTLNSELYAIVGVMPPGFSFPMTVPVASVLPSRNMSFWTPLGLASTPADRDSNMLGVVARLKAGVTLSQVAADMEIVSGRLAQQYPREDRGIGVHIEPLRDALVGTARRALGIFLAAITLVLLIACANVANLLFARSMGRQREMGLRAALGANRWRLVWQLLTESVLLALAGGALGVLLAAGGIPLLRHLAPSNVPRLGESAIDISALAYTFALSLLTGIIFGVVPAFGTSGTDLSQSLKNEGIGLTVSTKHSRLRGLLVLCEVALSLALLIGAGLMLKSFARLEHVDPGFRPDHLLTAWTVLPQTKYRQPEQLLGFYEQALKEIQALPGVEAVGATEVPPLSNIHPSGPFTVEGHPTRSDADASVAYRWAVSTGYFKTMGIPLLRGRTFAAADRLGAPGVVIINEAAGRRYWQGEDPVGKRLSFSTGDEKPSWFQVVGVVGDVRQDRLDAPVEPSIYLSMLQSPPSFLVMVIRTETAPAGLSSAVRGAVSRVDKDQPVYVIRTMEQMYSDSVAQRRFNMILLVGFGALALVLASVGIYGVMAYAVAQRTHEIGIRMALGARRSDVLRLIIREGLTLTLLGAAIGLAGALGTTQFLASLLYGVRPTDPAVFTIVPMVLISVALAACYIPARRATKVDPMVALRHE